MDSTAVITPADSAVYWDRIFDLIDEFKDLSGADVAEKLRLLEESGEPPDVINKVRIHLRIPVVHQEILPSTMIGGEYRITGRLGSGGMGIVYEAVLEKAGQTVALKMIHPDLILADSRARFLREMKALGQLDHPGIVGIRHAGSHQLSAAGGEISEFFTMERIPGTGLHEYLKQTGANLTERLRIVRDVAIAVAYAHDRHIIHRDLKPGNMIIRTDGRAMIFDFGLAAAVYAQDDEAAPLHAEGTPPYLAPEQATGAKPSPAADIYSLGAILYEILSGEPLYRFHQLAGHTAKIDAIRNPPPRPRLAVADASQALEDILDKALALAPEDRFPSAAAFARAINRLLPAHLVNEPPHKWHPAAGVAVPATDWVLEEKLGDGAHGQVWFASNRPVLTSSESPLIPPPRVYKFCATDDAARSLRREQRVFQALKRASDSIATASAHRSGRHPDLSEQSNQPATTGQPNAADYPTALGQPPAAFQPLEIPGIVPLETWSLDEPPYYIAMRWIEGSCDLREWIESKNHTPHPPSHEDSHPAKFPKLNASEALSASSTNPAETEADPAVPVAPPDAAPAAATGVHSEAANAPPADPVHAANEVDTAIGNASEAAAISIVCSVAGALQFASQNGVIHRDVSPANILVRDDPAAPGGVRAWLIDFGLSDFDPTFAKSLLTTSITDSQTRIVGAPEYIAPELKRGNPATTQSDLYSLGVVLFRLLRHDLTATLTEWKQHITDPFLREDLSRCLADDPTNRFPSASVLATSLQNLLTRRAAAEEAKKRHTESEVRNLQILEAEKRKAYRKGVVRTAVVLVCIFGVLTWLALTAWESSRQAIQRQAQLRLAEIATLRQSSAPGRRQQILNRFAEAKDNIPPEQKTAMREELIASLTMPSGTASEILSLPPGAALVQGGRWAVWADSDTWNSQEITFRGKGNREVSRLPSRVSACALTCDGQMAATVTKDGRLFAKAGKDVFREVTQGCGTESVAISCTGTIAAPGSAGGIRLFLRTAASWAEYKFLGAAPPVLSDANDTPVPGLAGPLIASAELLEFSPDGKWLASGGRSGLTVRIWNAETGSLMGEANHQDSIACMVWDPSVPGMLWSAARDGEICAWAMPSTGQEFAPLVRAWHRKASLEGFVPVSLAVSPDGISIAVASGGNACSVISRHNPVAFESMQTGTATACTYDNDSTLLVLSSSGVLFSSPVDMEFLSRASLGTRAVRSLAYTNADTTGATSTIVAGSSGATVGILDARDARRLLKLGTDLTGDTGGISFSPYEPKLFSVQSGLMRIWKWKTSPGGLTLLSPEKNEFFRAVDHLAAVGVAGTRWLAFSREITVGTKKAAHAGRLVTAALPAPETVWDLPGDTVSGIAAGPGYFAVSHSGGGQTHLCKPAVLAAERSVVLLPPPPEEVLAVACSGDGRWIAERTSGGVVVTDAAHMRRAGYFRIPRATYDTRVGVVPVVPIALSDGSNLLAITTGRQEVHLLELPAGERMATLTVPEEAGVASLIFTMSGDLIAGSADGRLFLWHLPAIRRELRRYSLDWDAPLQPVPVGQPIQLSTSGSNP